MSEVTEVDTEIKDMEFEEPQEQTQTLPPGMMTHEQVMQLLQAAQQLAQRPAETPLSLSDMVAQKRNEMRELLKKTQEGDTEAFSRYHEAQNDLLELQARLATQKETAGIQAMVLLRDVVDEAKAAGLVSPEFLSQHGQTWYQQMAAQVQANPQIYTTRDSIEKLSKFIQGGILVDESRSKRKAPAPSRESTGRFAAKDAPPAPKEEPLPPEAVAAGFTSLDDWKRLSSDGWTEMRR